MELNMNIEKKILVSWQGHYHFIEDLVNKLKENYLVYLDDWNNPNNSNNSNGLNRDISNIYRIEQLKKDSSIQIDVIFCEWCSSNAIFYSINKKPNQKLIIRLHRWELYSVHFFKVKWENVDKVIFISPFIRDEAIKRYSQYYKLNKYNFDEKYYRENNQEYFKPNEIIKNGWEHFKRFQIKTYGKIPNFKSKDHYTEDKIFAEKTIVIYNYIKKNIIPYNLTNSINSTNSINLDIKYNLGMVGYMPKLKRADISIEILKKLVEINPKYKLYIIGKDIKKIPWISNDITENEYYKNLIELIDKYGLKSHIIIEEFNENINEWYKKIGWILSTSDIEGSHHSIAEAMSCGSIPIICGLATTKYEMARIYSNEYCMDLNIDAISKKIIELNRNDDLINLIKCKCVKYSIENFSFDTIYKQINELVEFNLI